MGRWVSCLDVRTYGEEQFELGAVLEGKGLSRVSVCLPARDEAATIGAVIESSVLPHLAPGGSGLVDELVVVDDGSTDATAEIAQGAGARVVSRQPGGDKGRAMAAAFEASVGDVVVFLDADVENANARLRAAARRPPVRLRGGARKGLLRATLQRPALRRRPGHRAAGPPAHRALVPGAGRRSPTTGRGDGRSPVGLREGRLRARLRGRDRFA